MNLLICLCELKNLLRERLLWLLVIVTVFLSALASYNGHQWVATQNALIESSEQEQERALATSKKGLVERLALKQPINWWDDPYDLRGQAFYLLVNYANKPSLPSAAIAIGQSDVQPSFFKMLVTQKQAFIHQYEVVHPLALLIGKFDLAFFLIYVLPLLLIGVSFNALSQEKQSGQLRILMLQGLSPLRLLFNQLIVRASIIIFPLLLISVVALLLFSTSISLLTVGMLVFLILAYAVFWLALSALVISYGKTSAYNAAVLVITWLGFVVIVPALLNTMIVTLNTSPSRIEYVDVLRDKSDKVDRSVSKVMAQYFQDHPELARKPPSSKAAEEGNTSYSIKRIAKITALEKAMLPYDDAFQEVLMAQQNRAAQFSYLSPATILQTALFSLSGNGLMRHQDFIEQVLSHHEALRSFFRDSIAKAHERGDFKPCEGCVPRVTLADLSQVPKFSYQEERSSTSLNRLLVLLLFAGIFIFQANSRLSEMNRSQANSALV